LAERSSQAKELDASRAHALLEAGKTAEALTLLESLVEESPKNGGLLFRLGFALYLSAAPDNEPANVALRKRARTYFQRAKEAGLDQPLLSRALQEVQEDGRVREIRYSSNSAANSAVQQGERAFRKRDFATARRHYEEALRHEPTLYVAALFAGNTFYSEKNFPEAEAWFARAVAMDPNTETAFRYWGDALFARGRTNEAMEKYVEAFIADPYGGLAWRTLRDRAGELGRLRQFTAEHLPKAGIKLSGQKIDLSMPPKFGVLDVAYGTARAKWVGENRGRLFPNDAPYRQTLAEEADALDAVTKISAELRANAGEKKEIADALAAAQPAITLLADAASAGLIEPHILYLRANSDLVQDYPAYRAAHRDKLRQYIRRYMVNLD
jgi:tetratricopeptide (TPR) repeat protein